MPARKPLPVFHDSSKPRLALDSANANRGMDTRDAIRNRQAAELLVLVPVLTAPLLTLVLGNLGAPHLTSASHALSSFLLRLPAVRAGAIPTKRRLLA